MFTLSQEVFCDFKLSAALLCSLQPVSHLDELSTPKDLPAGDPSSIREAQKQQACRLI